MQKILSIIIVLLFSLNLHAGSASSSDLPKGLQGLSIGGVYYLKYQAGQEDDGSTNYNQFAVKRGYLTVKKKVNEHFTSRLTLDTHQDATGDLKVRVKYIYADFKL